MFHYGGYFVSSHLLCGEPGKLHATMIAESLRTGSNSLKVRLSSTSRVGWCGEVVLRATSVWFENKTNIFSWICICEPNNQLLSVCVSKHFLKVLRPRHTHYVWCHILPRNSGNGRIFGGKNSFQLRGSFVRENTFSFKCLRDIFHVHLFTSIKLCDL